MSGSYLAAPSGNDPFQSIAPGKKKVIQETIQNFARILLTSTFLEDAYRIIVDYDSQLRFLTVQRSMWWWSASLVLSVSVVAQIGGSVALIAKKQLVIAISGMSFVLLLQTVCYGYLFDAKFFIRNISVIGALVVLFANERQKEVRSNPFNGAFTLGGGSRLTYMQAVSRGLVALLFFSLMGGEWTWMGYIPVGYIGGVIVAIPVTAIVLGYKAKSCAGVLAIFLLAANVFLNGFFMLPPHHHDRDFKKYYFFQTLTVTGGLLVLTDMGAGGLSLDERNKDM